MNSKQLPILILFFLLFFQNTRALTPQQKLFDQYLKNHSWKLVFENNGTDAQKNWFLDGEQGIVTYTPDGIILQAGNTENDNASHVVLWTNQTFSGEIRVEYDFMRLDTNQLENNVNILYLHAAGSGKKPYTEQIEEWSELRKIPAMDIYFNHMNAFHISYAVNFVPYNRDYIRGRRYVAETGKGLQGTALYPEYADTGLFLPGKKYHITVLLTPDKLYMNVRDADQTKLFYFDIPAEKQLPGGYIGLRQMWTRRSLYSNFKVYEQK